MTFLQRFIRIFLKRASLGLPIVSAGEANDGVAGPSCRRGFPAASWLAEWTLLGEVIPRPVACLRRPSFRTRQRLL